jgi:hypothetical protein
MKIDKRKIKILYKQGNSLRGICRTLGISEGHKNLLSDILELQGISIRRTGKPEKTIGKYREEICPVCKQLRFVKARSVVKKNRDCRKCATTKSHYDNPRIGRAENHYNWKGGINLNKQGYVVEYVKKSNLYFSMAANSHRAGGYILQHRLVMAKHLGRCLEPFEVVHHINGNKQNNKIENLRLTNRNSHGLAYRLAYEDGYKQAMKDNNKVWNGED